MEIVVKPGQVLAEHQWRKDSEGKPLVKVFNPLVWKAIPPYAGSDPVTGQGTVEVPKAGWKQIDPRSLVKPKAAQEAEAEPIAEDFGDSPIMQHRPRRR